MLEISIIVILVMILNMELYYLSTVLVRLKVDVIETIIMDFLEK